MPRRLPNAILILLLLIAAVVSWQWLEDRKPDQSPQTSTISMAENQTDYTLEDFVITNVNNAKGQVYRLSGKSLSHFINDNNSIIDSPVLNLSAENNQQWSGNADIGYLSPDFSALQLSGNVELTHRRGERAPVNVVTSVLDIDTQTRQMTTSEKVEIYGEHWSFEARQMQADLDNGILQFQAGVEANYAVPD